MEIWKDIKGYEGKYQISNYGNVKSLINNIILKPLNGEYLRVILYKNKIAKTFYIHRLVGQNFISNSNNYKYINHKDENKHNNRVENLEWCTFKENMNYGTKQNRESKIKTKYHIAQYDNDNNLIKIWFNLREITLNTNYKKSNIQYCCCGKYKNAYGYKWKYIPI